MTIVVWVNWAEPLAVVGIFEGSIKTYPPMEACSAHVVKRQLEKAGYEVILTRAPRRKPARPVKQGELFT